MFPYCIGQSLGIISAGVEALWARSEVDVQRFLGVGGLAEGNELLEQRLQVAEGPLSGPINRRRVGVIVNLHKQTIHTIGNAGTCHTGDKLTETTAGNTTTLKGTASWLLEGMGHISNHWALRIAHPLEVTGIHNQIAVPNHGSTLADHDVGVASPADLVGRVAHHTGSAHLTLLDVDDLASLGSSNNQVGLTAQEGRDLDDISNLADLLSLPRLMDVGHYRDTVGVLHLLQDTQALLHARATEAGSTGAIGLVEGALEDVGDSKLVANRLDVAAHLQAVLLRLDDVGASHEEKTGGAGGGGLAVLVELSLLHGDVGSHDVG
mmetsp:Transcript_28567/g.80538  ORF Transcript_28567/g.80538 Transcript_28567/m.80538 type:complete len:322 (-) Transcript_28567:62-1027(-)